VKSRYKFCEYQSPPDNLFYDQLLNVARLPRNYLNLAYAEISRGREKCLVAEEKVLRSAFYART
jgi:hypothetical protein